MRNETYMLKDNVTMTMNVEVFDGEEMDTECFIDGSWVVSGNYRQEFAEKLKELIAEYCI